MALRVTADKNQLAGLQAACNKYNADAKAADTDPAPDLSVHVDLTPEQYWDKVHSDVAGKDERSEQEIFDQATMSYQVQFDVGLGAQGVTKILVDAAQAKADAMAQESAEELKARYVEEQAAAAEESKKVIAEQTKAGIEQVIYK